MNECFVCVMMCFVTCREITELIDCQLIATFAFHRWFFRGRNQVPHRGTHRDAKYKGHGTDPSRNFQGNNDQYSST